MALNYELFRTVVAPEFAAKADADLDVFAEEAELEISEKAFKKLYPRAVALITAHLIKMSELSNSPNGSTGELKKVKVGDISREYAVGESQADGDTYALTVYGKEYLRLRSKLLKTPMFVSR